MHKPMLRTIATVRNTFAKYMDYAGSVVIKTSSEVSDGAGGVTQTWTASGTVDAWLLPMSVVSQIDVAGAAAAERQMYNLALGTEVALSLGNQVVYGGITYEVVNMSHTTAIEWVAFQKAVIARVI